MALPAGLYDMRRCNWPRKQNACAMSANIWLSLNFQIHTKMVLTYFFASISEDPNNKNRFIRCVIIQPDTGKFNKGKKSPLHLEEVGIIIMCITIVLFGLFGERANYLSWAHYAHSPDTWQDCKAPEPRVNHWSVKETRPLAGRFTVILSDEFMDSSGIYLGLSKVRWCLKVISYNRKPCGFVLYCK